MSKPRLPQRPLAAENKNRYTLRHVVGRRKILDHDGDFGRLSCDGYLCRKKPDHSNSNSPHVFSTSNGVLVALGLIARNHDPRVKIGQNSDPSGHHE
jgi:hypothetical protein